MLMVAVELMSQTSIIIVDCFDIALCCSLKQSHCTHDSDTEISQHRELTLEKKILQWGLKPGTFWSQVQHSDCWAIPTPQCVCVFTYRLPFSGRQDLWQLLVGPSSRPPSVTCPAMVQPTSKSSPAKEEEDGMEHLDKEVQVLWCVGSG